MKKAEYNRAYILLEDLFESSGSKVFNKLSEGKDIEDKRTLAVITKSTYDSLEKSASRLKQRDRESPFFKTMTKYLRDNNAREKDALGTKVHLPSGLDILLLTVERCLFVRH